MNDDELRNALSRRAATPLTPDERNDVLRAARLAATEPRRRSFLPRIAGWVAGAAAVLVLVILAAPILISPPIGRPSPPPPTAVAATSSQPSADPSLSPSAAPSGGVKVYSAQELADKIGDPRAIGETVLAELPAGAIVPGECPAPAAPCHDASLSIDGATYRVLLADRDATEIDGTRYDDGNGYRWITPLAAPTDAGVYAFTFRQNFAEYLGPAYITLDGQPVKVSDIQGISSTMPSDGVIAVRGWLTKNWPPPPCPQPQLASPKPAMDYYCYGSWLTPKSDSSLDAGVHVQNDAYEFFAVSPSEDENGISAQEGVYLVRNAGCPEQAPCPAWRMVGRLDDVEPPIAAATASPPPEPVAIHTDSVPRDGCRLVRVSGTLIEDPAWGLALQQGDVVVGVVWPFGYSAARVGGRVALIDPSGRTVALTGDVIAGAGPKISNVWNACGLFEVGPSNPSSTAEPPSSPVPPPPPPPSGDSVPIQTGAPTNACDDGLLSGVLVEDPTSGLAIQTAAVGLIDVIWPAGFTAVRHGDQVLLVDENGDIRAETGDTLLVGGSLTSDKSHVWAACGQIDVAPPPPAAATLYIENRGGPFFVWIDGRRVATVACNDYPVIVAGLDGVPQLPWDMSVVRSSDDVTIFERRITELPGWYVQIGDESLGLSASPVEGPPGPTCSPN